MLYFPQLSTGALVQFPFVVKRSTRTILTETAGGNVSAMADADAERTTWTLRYVGLTDDERTAIEELFSAVQGRRQTFLFLNPVGNLLRWSEDLLEGVWIREGSVTVTEAEGTESPQCRVFRIANTGQTPQSISQVLSIPGELEYAISFDARSLAPSTIAVEMRTAGGSFTRTFTTGEGMTRFQGHGGIPGSSESTRLSLVIAPGDSVDLARIQLEAQPSASAYKATYSAAGVYSDARFAEDRLRIASNGANNHSAVIRITCGPGRE